MKAIPNQITGNKLWDNLFIKFPFWFPLSYIFLFLNFPFFNKFLFLGSLFVFAETHFASTWLFFFDKENWIWLKKNFFKFFFLPLYVAILSIVIWKISPPLILLSHYLASGWHVTKQSTGIIKIYGINPKIYTFFIYLISFFCLALGLNKPGLLSLSTNLWLINIIIGIFFLVYFCIFALYQSNKRSKIYLNLIPFITGITIYMPILFFEDLATATAVGVGMHWCQYIAIVWSLYIRKNKENFGDNKNLLKTKTILSISFVIIYSFIMTSLAIFGMPKEINGNVQYSIIYLIPILFQLYHFYIDGFIWKFSDGHIKKSILPYVFQK